MYVGRGKQHFVCPLPHDVEYFQQHNSELNLIANLQLVLGLFGRTREVSDGNPGHFNGEVVGGVEFGVNDVRVLGQKGKAPLRILKKRICFESVSSGFTPNSILYPTLY